MIKNTQGLEREAEERPREGFLEEEEAFELGLKERERGFDEARVEDRHSTSEWQGRR